MSSAAPIAASLRALLSGVIDYAGMFPPAKLPLEDAIRNYLRYREEPESWMLGRFICPAERLLDLASYLTETTGPPIHIASLGSGGANAEQFKQNLERDKAAVTAFREHARQAIVDVFEVRLPAGTPEDLESLIESAQSVGQVRCYFESPKLQADRLAPFINLVGRADPKSGLKFRCGGVDPAAYPSPNDLALVIKSCQWFPVPLKFTAGLHHPIRHFNEAAGGKIHGFINVLMAGLMCWATPDRPLEPVIEDEDPRHFTFDEYSVRWNDFLIPSKAMIKQFRQQFVSFGSCSFDEPRDDLRKLGWLP